MIGLLTLHLCRVFPCLLWGCRPFLPAAVVLLLPSLLACWRCSCCGAVGLCLPALLLCGSRCGASGRLSVVCVAGCSCCAAVILLCVHAGLSGSGSLSLPAGCRCCCCAAVLLLVGLAVSAVRVGGLLLSCCGAAGCAGGAAAVVLVLSVGCPFVGLLDGALAGLRAGCVSIGFAGFAGVVCLPAYIVNLSAVLLSSGCGACAVAVVLLAVGWLCFRWVLYLWRVWLAAGAACCPDGVRLSFGLAVCPDGVRVLSAACSLLAVLLS